MNTLEHVSEFLAPLSPQHLILSAAKSLLDKASGDVELKNAIFRLIEKHQANTVDVEHYKEFERLAKNNKYKLKLKGVPNFIQPFLAAAYLRTKINLQNPEMRSKVLNIGKREITQADKTISRSESDFLGKLLIETTNRLISNKIFAQNLQAGLDELGEILPQINQPSEELIGGGSSSLTCQICHPDPQNPSVRVCDPTSCGVVIIIIIIIIGSKAVDGGL